MKIGKLYKINSNCPILHLEGNMVIIKDHNRLIAKVYNMNTKRMEDYFIEELTEVKK